MKKLFDFIFCLFLGFIASYLVITIDGDNNIFNWDYVDFILSGVISIISAICIFILFKHDKSIS